MRREQASEHDKRHETEQPDRHVLEPSPCEAADSLLLQSDMLLVYRPPICGVPACRESRSSPSVHRSETDDVDLVQTCPRDSQFEGWVKTGESASPLNSHTKVLGKG